MFPVLVFMDQIIWVVKRNWLCVVEDQKIKYDITMKVGLVEEDLFTEVKGIDSSFVKISKD